MLAVDAEQVVIPLALALVGAVLGYALRAREWIRDRRLDAYSRLAASVDDLASTRALVYSMWIQLGDGFESGSANFDAAWVRLRIEETEESVREFRRCAQRASLLASKDAGRAQLDLTEYVGANLVQLQPFGDYEAPSVGDVIEKASEALWKYLAVAVKDVRRGEIAAIT